MLLKYKKFHMNVFIFIYFSFYMIIFYFICIFICFYFKIIIIDIILNFLEFHIMRKKNKVNYKKEKLCY